MRTWLSPNDPCLHVLVDSSASVNQLPVWLTLLLRHFRRCKRMKWCFGVLWVHVCTSQSQRPPSDGRFLILAPFFERREQKSPIYSVFLNGLKAESLCSFIQIWHYESPAGLVLYRSHRRRLNPDLMRLSWSELTYFTLGKTEATSETGGKNAFLSLCTWNQFHFTSHS